QEGEEAARPLTPTPSPPAPAAPTMQGETRGTREAGGQRPQEASRSSRARQRLSRPAVAALPQGEGADAPLAQLRLPRPSCPQRRLPLAVDPAHQRRGPRQRHDL